MEEKLNNMIDMLDKIGFCPTFKDLYDYHDNNHIGFHIIDKASYNESYREDWLDVYVHIFNNNIKFVIKGIGRREIAYTLEDMSIKFNQFLKLSQMQDNYIINMIAEIYGNHIIILQYPDYNGGHDMMIEKGNYELQAHEYIEAEGSVRELWEKNPVMTSHKEPLHEEPRDYEYTFKDWCRHELHQRGLY